MEPSANEGLINGGWYCGYYITPHELLCSEIDSCVQDCEVTIYIREFGHLYLAKS